ncbi:MAG: 2TM domain-containing protein [Hyphomicrobiaceae bacterium]|jgi:hypothetical protein
MDNVPNKAANSGADYARLDRARRQLAAVEGFYIHLAAFAIVIAALVALNWATGDEWWVQWVFAGWGLGVVAHALAVFGKAPAALRHWEQRKVREYMRGS